MKNVSQKAKPIFRFDKKSFKRSLPLYALFLLPALYFIIFKYGTISYMLIAFKDYKVLSGVWGSEWVGLEHFKSFLSDPYFWVLIKNTLLLNIYSILFGFPVPIILALMINNVRQKHLKKTIQSISYLPHFISTVVVCGLITTYLATDGAINQLIMALGGEATPFLSQSEWFRTIYITSGIWQSAGWGSIIYLAALSGVDPQLYESATLDGASKLQQAWHISIPSISYTISIQLILTVGSILSIGYEKILLLYTGATYEVADVISTYVYRRGIEGGDYSYSTAVSLFQALIALIFIVVTNKVANKYKAASLW